MSRFKFNGTQTFKLYTGGYEKRLMQKIVVNIDGKTVSVYNTHLTHNSSAVRKKQFAQIVDILDEDKNDYIILTGDFNAKMSEFSVFSDYTVVNTEETKYYDYSKNTIDVSKIDNIVVTKNINVINSRIVITKLSDHYPVFAYLVLN
jgi:endonuclease/exonuclease/phosphatase family metal-dependent hydrolase